MSCYDVRTWEGYGNVSEPISGDREMSGPVPQEPQGNRRYLAEMKEGRIT